MFIGWIILIAFWGLVFSIAVGVLVSKCYKKKMQRKRSFLESQNCASTNRKESQLPQMPSIETKEGQQQFESGIAFGSLKIGHFIFCPTKGFHDQ